MTWGQVIINERPDGILLSFGGQTALNCGVELQQNGVSESGVDLLHPGGEFRCRSKFTPPTPSGVVTVLGSRAGYPSGLHRHDGGQTEVCRGTGEDIGTCGSLQSCLLRCRGNHPTHPGVMLPWQQAVEAGKILGYPVLVRAAFSLGGLGSGFASDQSELESLAKMAFAHTKQVYILLA